MVYLIIKMYENWVYWSEMFNFILGSTEYMFYFFLD